MSVPIAPAEQRGRMRVSKACDPCRSQKIKCSGTYPCSTCIRHKRECVYNANSSVNRTAAMGPLASVPTILNAQHQKELPFLIKTEDKQYIRHLENRIQYLESRLSPDANTLTSNLRTGDPENEETSRFVNPSSKWRYSNRNQILLVQELCASVYETLSPENRAKVVLPRYQYFGWNLSGTHYLSADPLPELPEFKLPQPVEFYTEYFFREINELFAIIHEPVFKLQLSAYQEQMAAEPNFDEHQHNDEPETKPPRYTASKGQAKLFEAILYLIIALAIRFTEFQKKKNLSLEMLETEEKMFKYSYKIVSGLSFQWESFELIQCWLLITLYLRVTHRQTSYFIALGHAVTMAKVMGISRATRGLAVPGTPYEEMKAKRVFWALFVFERTLGLQSGRYNMINERDIELQFPDLSDKLNRAKDTWLTLPGLAMIHIARLASFVHTANVEKLDLVKYQQINKEIVQMNNWLNENGFNNNEIFNNPKEKISSMVKCQVKLHFYDLILSVHGKVLFNFLGRRIATPGLKIEMVLDASTNVVDVLCKIHKANMLYTPWHLNLLLLFNAAVNFLVLINSGMYSTVARENYSRVIQLLTVLKKANVKSEDNKVIIKKRFKMAEECLWAVKTAGKALSLRFEQDLQNLEVLGGDPGSSDVNRETFSQYGYQADQDNELNDIMRTGKKRKIAPPFPSADQAPNMAYNQPAQAAQAQHQQQHQAQYMDQMPQPQQMGYDLYEPQMNNLSTPEMQSHMNNILPMAGRFGTSTSSDYSEVNEINPDDPSYTNKDNVLANQLAWFDQWDDQLLGALSMMEDSNDTTPVGK